MINWENSSSEYNEPCLSKRRSTPTILWAQHWIAVANNSTVQQRLISLWFPVMTAPTMSISIPSASSSTSLQISGSAEHNSSNIVKRNFIGNSHWFKMEIKQSRSTMSSAESLWVLIGSGGWGERGIESIGCEGGGGGDGQIIFTSADDSICESPETSISKNFFVSVWGTAARRKFCSTTPTAALSTKAIDEAATTCPAIFSPVAASTDAFFLLWRAGVDFFLKTRLMPKAISLSAVLSPKDDSTKVVAVDFVAIVEGCTIGMVEVGLVRVIEFSSFPSGLAGGFWAEWMGRSLGVWASLLIGSIGRVFVAGRFFFFDTEMVGCTLPAFSVKSSPPSKQETTISVAKPCWHEACTVLRVIEATRPVPPVDCLLSILRIVGCEFVTEFPTPNDGDGVVRVFSAWMTIGAEWSELPKVSWPSLIAPDTDLELNCGAETGELSGQLWTILVLWLDLGHECKLVGKGGVGGGVGLKQGIGFGHRVEVEGWEMLWLLVGGWCNEWIGEYGKLSRPWIGGLLCVNWEE